MFVHLAKNPITSFKILKKVNFPKLKSINIESECFSSEIPVEEVHLPVISRIKIDMSNLRTLLFLVKRENLRAVDIVNGNIDPNCQITNKTVKKVNSLQVK